MKKTFKKKLQFKKMTITTLNRNQLLKIIGGSATATQQQTDSSSVRCQTSAACKTLSLQ